MKYKIIIIALSITILLLLFVKCDRNVSPIVITTTDTIHGDSIPVEIQIEVPVPYAVYLDTSTHNNIDTSQIIKDYFSKKCYTRILKNDTSAYAAITDTTYMNSLTEGFFVFQNRRPTIVYNTTTIYGDTSATPQRYHLYLGIKSSFAATNKIGIGAGIKFQDKKGRMYEYSYDPVLKFHEIGYFIKLK